MVYYWLLVGGLEHVFSIYWESSSQLTNILQRGGLPTQIITVSMGWLKGKSKPDTIDFPMISMGFSCNFSLKPINWLYTWWIIPLSKWVISPVISGLTLLIPFIPGDITHLLSGMIHQVMIRISQWRSRHASFCRGCEPHQEPRAKHGLQRVPHLAGCAYAVPAHGMGTSTRFFWHHWWSSGWLSFHFAC